MFWTSTQAAQALARVYDTIAPEFAQTRQHPWAELTEFLKHTPVGATVLDLGCGSGRILPLLQQKKCRVIGFDQSTALLKIAKAAFPDIKFQQGDFTQLPFPAENFMAVWAIASLHHLPTKTARAKAFSEIWRVLKPSGTLVLTVWNLWAQKKYAFYRWRAFWRSFFLPAWQRNDFLIPWGQQKEWRYYHAFCVEEVLALARQSGFSLLEWWGAKNGQHVPLSAAENLCFRLQKTKISSPAL